MGIARGGVIVADPIAEELKADFDIIVPRKLRSPHNSEYALGSIMHDESVYLDTPTLVTQNDISKEYIEMEKLEQKREMERRLTMYRPHGTDYKIRNRTVILVDDGIATGATIIAGCKMDKKTKSKTLDSSRPCCAKESCRAFEGGGRSN